MLKVRSFIGRGEEWRPLCWPTSRGELVIVAVACAALRFGAKRWARRGLSTRIELNHCAERLPRYAVVDGRRLWRNCRATRQGSIAWLSPGGLTDEGSSDVKMASWFPYPYGKIRPPFLYRQRASVFRNRFCHVTASIYHALQLPDPGKYAAIPTRQEAGRGVRRLPRREPFKRRYYVSSAIAGAPAGLGHLPSCAWADQRPCQL